MRKQDVSFLETVKGQFRVLEASSNAAHILTWQKDEQQLPYLSSKSPEREDGREGGEGGRER